MKTVCSTHPGRSAALLAALAFGFTASAGPARACGQNPIIGEICAFAGTRCPPLYIVAQGQTYPVGKENPLAALWGSYFGGDGVTTFRLPDLRGRMMVGGVASKGPPPSGMVGLGQAIGSVSVTLSAANMAPHVHSVTATATLNIMNAFATFNAIPAAAPPTLAPNTTVYMTSASAGGGPTALKGPYTLMPPGIHDSVAQVPVYLSMANPVVLTGAYTGVAGSGSSVPVQTPARALTYCIAQAGQYPMYPPSPPPSLETTQ